MVLVNSTHQITAFGPNVIVPSGWKHLFSVIVCVIKTTSFIAACEACLYVSDVMKCGRLKRLLH